MIDRLVNERTNITSNVVVHLDDGRNTSNIGGTDIAIRELSGFLGKFIHYELLGLLVSQVVTLAHEIFAKFHRFVARIDFEHIVERLWSVVFFGRQAQVQLATE